MYSIALVLVAPSPDLAGLGKAIEAGVPPSLLWPWAERACWWWGRWGFPVVVLVRGWL